MRAGVKSGSWEVLLHGPGSTPAPQSRKGDPGGRWKSMDAIIKGKAQILKPGADSIRPSRDEAEDAVRTLIAWAGDDPRREGLLDTPKRVVDAYGEWFEGYSQDPMDYLSKTFEDVKGYDDIVMLRDIDVESHCEHHMAPFLGTACVAYMPTEAVVGISKLARVVEIYAKRLQTQETMTSQIAQAINESLLPKGVAVMIDAKHECMTTRGVHHPNVSTITTQFTGVFKTDQELRERFLRLAGK
jgi:GTP cyclohydrolase IA